MANVETLAVKFVLSRADIDPPQISSEDCGLDTPQGMFVIPADQIDQFFAWVPVTAYLLVLNDLEEIQRVDRVVLERE